MTQKHTPGPWTAKVDLSVVSEKNEPIALVALQHTEYQNFIKESHSNACLIAAAPELLEALELCISAMFPGCPDDEWSIAYEKACAVIAKATNQPKE